jgi:putative ABC transport system permease protein
MLKLAFRNIFRQKMRTALTLAAIAFGVAGLILSGGFVEDIFVQLREATIHARLGHVQVYRAGFTTFGRGAPYRYMISDPEEQMERLRKIGHVEDVLPRLQFAGLLSNGKANYSVIGDGVDPDKEARLGSFVPAWMKKGVRQAQQRAFTLVYGRQLTAKDTYGILLGEGVASAMKLAPGDSATVLLNTPDGALNSLDFQIVGVFRTFSKDYDDRAVRIRMAAAQELVATKAVHALVLSLDDTAQTNAVAAALRRDLPPKEYEIRTWLDLADFYQKTVALYRRQFGVLQLITLCMVLLTVANSVNMTIFERTGEVGTMMALGNRQNEVWRLVVLENIIMGLLGAGLGVGLGLGLATGISALGIPMPPPPNSDAGYTAYIRVVPEIAVRASLAGFLATALAALLPARRASRLPVVDALRQN